MRNTLTRLLRSRTLYLVLSLLFVAGVTFLQLQASVSRIPFLNGRMSISVLLWNYFTFCLLLVLLTGIFGRICLALLVWSIVAFGLSIANYYILLFHGAPLTFHILGNFSTAMDVISSYRFSLDLYSCAILLGFAACLVAVLVAWKAGKGTAPTGSVRKRLAIAALSTVLLFGNIYLGIFSDYSFKPRNSITFSWASSAGEYGFLPLQLESHFQETMYISSITDYSEESVYALYEDISGKSETNVPSQYPDIILILNECFYDLNQVVDLDTNISPLANYYSLENAVKGYIVASGEGGGTNRSEYELLTSISTTLIPNQTPFHVLDVANHCSVVSYLEAMGYETYGAHCGRSANYNRKYSYSAMGFDHSFFDVDFVGLESYGNRANTDASAYKNLIAWYEVPSEQPKFMYLLTYQNHGGWEQNPAQLDTVNVTNDFGEYTSQANEYLSSLKLSDEELVNLLAYFETVDRPVIVCMLGDHGPSFAKNIADPSISEQDLAYLIKSTPLLIWSNYGLEAENIGYASLNYVVPKLMETAGLPLSPFYRYQLDIMQDIPIIMSYSTYYDKDLVLRRCEENPETAEYIQNYFSMCFNNLQDNRLIPLFAPVA